MFVPDFHLVRFFLGQTMMPNSSSMGARISASTVVAAIFTVRAPLSSLNSLMLSETLGFYSRGVNQHDLSCFSMPIDFYTCHHLAFTAGGGQTLVQQFGKGGCQSSALPVGTVFPCFYVASRGASSFFSSRGWLL
jgi:hypothetical protein